MRMYQDIDVRVVNTSNIRGAVVRKPFTLFQLIFSLILSIFRADVVSVHCATTALPTLGLITTVISRIARKPLIIRKFAGLDYFELGTLRGNISHYLASHADHYLTETKRLKKLAETRGLSNVSWYPTSRPDSRIEQEKSREAKKCRRFVFAGHVSEYKGINELVEAAERFDADVSVDIYGPMFSDLDPTIFDDLKRVTFHGPIPYEEVESKLLQYDMNLLPSKATTEGYPGIVLDGYSVGVPIIASNIGGISEIVDESSGILIEPGNADALFDAMNKVVNDNDLYESLRRGARDKFKGFTSEHWTDQFVKICREFLY
jgi:glycosyltransferase involved in cell wall biosynthesis